MRGDANAYWCQKKGSEPREYEDAFSISEPGSGGFWSLTPDGRRLRVAVADGATESMLSGHWAKALVQTYTTMPQPQLRRCIRRAQDAWPQILVDYKAEREENEKPIAWYEEPGLERGAHATLLVAEFRLDPAGFSGTWTAEAVGDSCLFHVSDNRVQRAFPLSLSSQFDSSPALVHTGLRSRRLLDKHRAYASGSFRSGDQFFLCTDALAAWFLEQDELGTQPWLLWCALTDGLSAAGFSEWIAAERSSGRLKNDDVTLLSVRLP